MIRGGFNADALSGTASDIQYRLPDMAATDGPFFERDGKPATGGFGT